MSDTYTNISTPPGTIVATERGFVMELVSTTKEEATCRYLSNPDQMTFPHSQLRLLATSYSPPLVEEPNYQTLIEERNVVIANLSAGKSKREVSQHSKMLAELKTASVDQVKEIMTRYGIKTDK